MNAVSRGALWAALGLGLYARLAAAQGAPPPAPGGRRRRPCHAAGKPDRKLDQRAVPARLRQPDRAAAGRRPRDPNIQPVVPIPRNRDWNLISRTIVPVVWQNDIFPGAGNQFGLSGTVQALFLSPARPKGIIWGAGPAFLIPTAPDRLLGTEK